jgi:serine/threonine protein kinase
MMNDDNDRTVVRTREMPGAADSGDPGHSVNVLPPGTRLGEFEVVNLIGEGGFGIVYLAYDHSLERHVALKEYMPSGLATRTTRMAVTVKSQHNAGTFTAGLKSFINEARLLAQFDSPSLVKVHSFCSTPSRPSIARSVSIAISHPTTSCCSATAARCCSTSAPRAASSATSRNA